MIPGSFTEPGISELTMEKLFQISVYILIFGGVFALIIFSLNKSIIQIASKDKLKGSKENYYIVKDFITENNMKTDVVVHTGTAVMYHRGRKTVYINEKVAKSKELYSLSACLHEIGEALARERFGILYMLKTYLTMIIRAIAMLTPLLLVIALLLRKMTVLYIAVFILAVNIVYSLLLIPVEYLINIPVKCFVEKLEIENREKNILKSLLDSYVFDASVSVFKPFVNIFRYVAGLSDSTRELRIESYEKAIDEAEKKRQQKKKERK